MFSFGPNGRIIVKNNLDCIFCNECLKHAIQFQKEDLIDIKEGDFLFEFETIGQLQPDEILHSAFEQLDLKLSQIAKQLSQIRK